MKNPKEKLLVELIHLLSEKFKEKIVLEGGMLLRLLNSPRATQDVDCIFLSTLSKKELAIKIEQALKKRNDINIKTVKLNSRGIFIGVESTGADSEAAMLEINVAGSLNLKPEQLSTAPISNQYGIMSHIISVVSLPEAFANKIAACVERENMRDLYDLSIFEPLCDFDSDTLKKRFAQVSIGRKKPMAISPKDAADKLQKRATNLTEKRLKDELYPLIPSEQRQGLIHIIKSAINKIAGKIELIS